MSKEIGSDSDSVVMAQDVCVIVGAEDRARLAAVVGVRRRPLKHVQRARIVLASANRLPVAEVARRAGVSRPVGRGDFPARAVA